MATDVVASSRSLALEHGMAKAFAVSDVSLGPVLQVRNLSIRYRAHDNGQPFEAVKDVTFDVGRHQLVAVVGPSGCGKSTLLSAVAGLIPYQRGQILVENTRVTKPGKDRAVVFQHAALLPWLTVRKNVAFGTRQRGADKATALKRADEMLELVRLTQFANHYPYQLSGGMQQRVNLARALATDPQIMLLDEPFAALDAQHRELLQNELMRIWDSTDKAGIFITHQIDEAIFVADVVVVLSSGPGSVVKEILEIDLPRPRDRRVTEGERFGAFARKIRSVLETSWADQFELDK
ncbi:MAG: ABC transporter ATP-binding protein [Acidimicrobiales bacterium]